MSELDNGNALSFSTIVTPSTLITQDAAFMKGHGTFVEKEKIYSSVSGTVDRINKLISVKSLKQRFVGEIGDTIVGRVTKLSQKRWMVDINSRQDAVLLLSSVNLPGGVQRRKSESDELQMRKFFKEGDLVFAEVQSLFGDGALSLHTRSVEYGKLRNGVMIKVNPLLVVRSRSHLHSLPCQVDVVLGVNGYIFIGKKVEKDKLEDISELLEMYSDTNDEIDELTRSNIARVYNSILILDRMLCRINDTTINCAFELGLPYQTSQLTNSEIADEIAVQVRIKIAST
ncbi:hypothetical protein BB561_001844 [Smittium simulii]|uniref:S1 motif domain-containing protein n=1 Tax=Smittium simulii TaxID=133385 RepID=A0A2T9YSU4_9FUNG|nr:hypothetical protein BB561_001844 [Smittium simulii]